MKILSEKCYADYSVLCETIYLMSQITTIISNNQLDSL